MDIFASIMFVCTRGETRKLKYCLENDDTEAQRVQWFSGIFNDNDTTNANRMKQLYKFSLYIKNTSR